MKWLPVFAFAVLTLLSTAPAGAQTEPSGDTARTRAALARAAQDHPNDVSALTGYAEFLERYGDPACRDAYARLLEVLRGAGDTARAAAIARRLAVIDLLDGKGSTAAPVAAENWPTVPIPGPWRPFARMAAISPEADADEMLSALAHNVVTNGYQASHSNEALEPTEYLKLVHRYLSQARELDKLAGDGKVIQIASCDSANVADLLRILGYRMRGGCGSEVVLETVNAPRAFLTTDSGFPLNGLEQALRTNRPFSYDFHPALVPVFLGWEYWMTGVKDKTAADFIETFISDPSVCRLYLGLSKLDRETAEGLRKAVPFTRLKAYAHVLDFFGGMFELQGGKAVTPGGQRAAAAWGEMVGASPDQGATFFEKLIAKDDGWMASLYDALARIHGPVRDYLTDPARMKRFYAAVRGRVTSPGPARPVFRSNTDMMLLTTRLQLDAGGKPHIPGSLEVWKNLFVSHPQGKYDGKLTRSATGWKDPDDVLEALFGLCRKAVENEPLKIFMALTDVDRNRAVPLEAATVDRLARAYHDYGSQYAIFSESRGIGDKSINQYMDAIASINRIKDPLFFSDVAGSFQALVGLWQILVRQQSIPESQADQVFSGIAGGFLQIRNDRELFDAGRGGVKLLVAGAAPGPAAPARSSNFQERLVDLLAGAPEAGDTEAREQMTQEIVRILEAQRAISLDTMFQLADHMEGLSHGEKLNTALVNRLAGGIAGIQAPRAPLTGAEKTAMGFGYWTERHIDAERKLNLRAAIEKAAGDAEKLKEARGLMAPLLRDTLVAFNYAHYAPPGAQILYTNPVFVRSHDFVGAEGASHMWRPTELFGTGWPSNGGGRLVGSLSTLPYTLAEAEQNFLIPEHTQALIWGDLAPQMILDAKIPRWWNVTPAQVHWVGLHLRYGRELLAESAFDAELRAQVLDSLSQMAPPARTHEVGALIERGAVKDAVERVTPSELFWLARDMASRQGFADSSCILAELRQLAQASPREVNYAAISRAFGTPKPTLANSYQPELLNLRTFPTLMGYSSRMMAESWESNSLYWAALADELSVPPAQLNLRIPEWTQELVERIFASHLEDWPAVLKSLRLVGDDVRTRTRAAAAGEKAGMLEGGEFTRVSTELQTVETHSQNNAAEAIEPGQVGVVMQLARDLAAKAQYPEAEKLYRGVIEKDKTYQYAYTELYRLLMIQGKPADAEQVLRLGAQNNPKQFGYLSLLAMHYYTQKQRDDLVGILNQIESHADEFVGAYLIVGDFYLRMGDGDSAVREYREGMAKDAPKKATYEKRIIEALMRQGKRTEAAELNSQILKDDPNDNDARGLAATFMLDKGDVAGALSELQAVEARSPDNPVAQYNLGRAHAACGELEQARQLFQKAIDLRPDYILARLALAQLQLTQRDFDAALKSAEQVLAIDANNNNARLIESTALLGQKKFADSRQLLDFMLKANPSSPDVLFQLGVVNLAENKYQEAEDAFKRSYDLNPANSRGLMGMVETEMAQNHPDQALQLLQTESDKAPTRMDLALALGNTALRAGKFDMAVSYYEKVLASLPKGSAQQGDIYLRIGETYRQKGNLTNSIAALQKARQILPENGVVLSTLALVLDGAGRWAEATQVYEVVIKLDPNNGVALNNLAFLLAEHGGDLDDALTKAQRARQLLPNTSEISDTLGWIYLKKNMTDNAIDIFKDLVDKVPGQAIFRYHLGMAYSQKGDKTLAVKELQDALKYNPTKADREKIEQLIASIE